MPQIADALFHDLCTGYLHDGDIENHGNEDLDHHAKEHAGKKNRDGIGNGAGCQGCQQERHDVFKEGKETVVDDLLGEDLPGDGPEDDER